MRQRLQMVFIVFISMLTALPIIATDEDRNVSRTAAVAVSSNVSDDEFPSVAVNQIRALRVEACQICEGCSIPPDYMCCTWHQDCGGGEEQCFGSNKCTSGVTCDTAPIYQGCRFQGTGCQSCSP